MVREIPFHDRDVPELFAHRIVRVEMTTGGIVRFWLAVEEPSPSGTSFALILRLLVPLDGVLAHQQMVAAAIASGTTEARTTDLLATAH